MTNDCPDLESVRFFATQYKEMDPTAVMAFIAVMRLSHNATQAMAGYFQKMDLSHSGFMVMMVLCRFPAGEVTPAHLADKLSISRASISSLLDTLEAKDWVKRQPDPDDRRSCVILLTAAGKAKLDSILPGHYQRIAQMMADISESDRETFVEICKRLNQRVTAFGEQDQPVLEKAGK